MTENTKLIDPFVDLATVTLDLVIFPLDTRYTNVIIIMILISAICELRAM